MIKNFSRIKSVATFDFTWNQSVKPFEKFNVFYGWNGSGKTTVSRILSVLESGKNTELDFGDDSLCIIKTEREELRIKKDSLPNPLKNIRVFNEDFVRNNLKWDTHHATPILIVGADKIEQKENLDQLRSTREVTENDLAHVVDNLETANKEKERALEKGRDAIKQELTAVMDVEPLGARATLYRNYTVNSVESILNDNAIIYPNFTDEQKMTNKQALADSSKLDSLSDFAVDLNWLSGVLTSVEQIFSTSLSKQAMGALSQELKENPDLEPWVESGHLLHRDSQKPVMCKFCTGEIKEERLVELDRYFDEVRVQLLSDIDRVNDVIDGHLLGLGNPDNSEKFYQELRNPASTANEQYSISRQALEKALTALRRNLENKRKRPHEKIDFFVNDYEEKRDEVKEAVTVINQVIKQHNKKTKSFQKAREIAAHDLERFIVKSFKADYEEAKRKIMKLEERARELKTAILASRTQEADLEHKLRDHGQGANQFNQLLKSFLGRDEIRLKAVDGGYEIKRHDKPARNLSEGEKNAVALIFFLTKLKEDGFEQSCGIIAIDDPVSSFDSQNTYQAFSFIKANLQELKPVQVFLLTHNFHLFRLVHRWLNYEAKNAHQLYLIKCKTSISGKRVSVIENLDPLLRDHDSEYAYLFKLVHTRSISDVNGLEKDYILPNVIRKLLENYLSFKVPLSENLHSKFSRLLEDHKDQYLFTATSRHRIETYCQDSSHALQQDSPMDFDEKSLGELTEACRDIMTLIKNTDERHYNHLVKQIQLADGE